MRIHRKDVDELQEAGDHAGAEEALRDEVRIVGVPLLAGVVGVDAGRLLPLDDDEGGHAEDDPADEAHVGEAVGDVPEVRHVLEDAELVDQLDLLPDEREHPKDDDAPTLEPVLPIFRNFRRPLMKYLGSSLQILIKDYCGL